MGNSKYLLSVCALLPSFAFAASGEKGAESWDGEIAFSASTATGNTENTVLGLTFDARRIHGRYTHDIQSGVDYVETGKTLDDGSTSKVRTRDRWFVQYRGEVQTGDRTFVYGRTRYEEDQFSGFENRVFVGGGVGHTAIESETMKLALLAGPGLQYTQLSRDADDQTNADDSEESEFAFYAGSDFSWDIAENVSFDHKFDTTWAETNTTLETIFALKTKLTENIATKLDYRVKHETMPPEGREDTDTRLSASVAYGF